MSEKFNSEIAVIGIDIGKNSFHIVGQDRRGSIVLRQKWSRGQDVRGSIADVSSSFVMEEIKATTVLPLDYAPSNRG